MKYKGIELHVFGHDHPPPHVHAVFAEHEALIVISDCSVYRGSLPKQKLALAKEFTEANRTVLLKTFNELNPNLIRE